MSTELATAWIRLIPSTDGIQENLVGELTGAGRSAGEAGGREAGSKFSGSFGKMIGGAALTAGVVGAFKGLYDVGSTWEDVTNTISVGTGTQGEALSGLVDDTKGVARQVPADLDQVGQAITGLNTLTGASGESLQGLTTSVLEASRMLGEDGAANAEAFGQSMKQWQVPAEDGPEIMDALFKSTQDYGMGLGAVMGNLNEYGSVLQNAGFSMEESAALFGQLESSGLSVSSVMPGLNSAFRSWADEGKNVQDELHGTVGAIEDAETKSEALSLATEAFGAEGAQRLTTAIRSGSFELGDLSGALANADGLISDTAEDTMTFSDHWGVLKNNAMTALEPMATTLVESLGGALQEVTPYLLDFATFLGENEWLLGTIATLIGTTVVAAMVAWTASIWASTAALLANPITWVVLAVAGLIAALVALVMNWDAVVAFLRNVFAAVITWVMGLINGFATWWSGVWSGITSFLGTVIAGGMNLLQSLLRGGIALVRGIINGFFAFWSAIWTGITNFLGSVIRGGMNLLQALIQGGVNFVTSIVTGFFGFWSGIWSSIGNFLGNTISAAMNLLRSLLAGGINFGRSLISGFLGFWSGIWGSVLSTLTGIGSSILGFLSSTWSGLVGTAQDYLGNLMDFVTGLPGRVTGVFANAGSWLLDAGGDIIQGFIDGITGMFGTVQDTLGGLTDFLPDWKGPPERDAVLLKGAGQLVMGGFTEGLESEYSAVQNSLGRFTAEIPGAVRAPSPAEVQPATAQQQAGMTVQGPLVEVAEMSVDSEDRTKKVAQELWVRASRAGRSKGAVNLGGVVS